MLSDTDRLRPARAVAFRELDGQVVIVHAQTDVLLTLNETGTAVWRRLDGRTVSEVVQALGEEFDAPTERLHAEVIAFLEQMLARRLVEPAPSRDA